MIRRDGPLSRRAFGATAFAVLATTLAACSSSSGGSAGASSSSGLKTVRMVQEWPVADGFWIPWVVAKEKGYYKDAGIDLEIVTPPNTAATMQLLGTNKAELAFSTSIDVTTAASQGVPVVGIARYGSANNWGLYTKGSTPIAPADLKGKKIGTYNDAWSNAQLSIMLGSAGLALKDVTLVSADSDTVPLLTQGKVDAITGITNAEGSELESLGEKDISISLSKDAGAPDAPVFAIAANSSWLKSNPDLAKKFISATLKGMNYARSNPDEAVSIFMKTYPDAQTEEFTKLQWAATSEVLGTAGQDLTVSDLEQSQDSWQSVVDVAKKYDVITDAKPATDYFTNGVLQQS